jgi:transcriptional regulator with XRE-family HTH domain
MIMNHLHAQAIQLRKKGYSYSLIKDRLGVSKSTLSNWLSEVPFRPNKEVLQRINTASLKMVRTKQYEKFRIWNTIKQEATHKVGVITKRDLFMLGLGLYIGEGAKSYSTVAIANSNPKIIKLAIEWFSKISNVPRENFVLAIHLYPDNNVNEAIKFWEKNTGIPRTQFIKTQVDKRTNKHRIKRKMLPHGTANLRVKAKGNPRFGVQLLRRILAWIDSTTN